jgi:pilus assembly protein CpaE
MKIAILGRSEKLLKVLEHDVETAGHEVSLCRMREAGLPLASQLQGIHADLLLLDGTCDPDGDLAAVEALARTNPLMAVLMLSPRRDSEDLLASMRAGVREVLNSPPSATELAEALRRVQSRSKKEPAGGRIIAFIPCKGGSGATFLATNLAYLLAVENKKRVALIDLDLQYGDASFYISEGPPRGSIADLATQLDRLDAKLLNACMMQIAPGLRLLPAPETHEASLAFNSQQLETIIGLAREGNDFVVIDVGRMFDSVALKALDKADLIMPVTQSMVPYVRDAKRLITAFRSLGYPDSKVHLIVNRFEKNAAVDIKQIEKAIGMKVWRTVPNNFRDVSESINSGMPLLKTNPNSPVTSALSDIAEQLTGNQKQSGARGLFSRMINRSR